MAKVKVDKYGRETEVWTVKDLVAEAIADEKEQEKPFIPSGYCVAHNRNLMSPCGHFSGLCPDCEDAADKAMYELGL